MNHISVHEEDAEIVEHLRAFGVEAEYRLPTSAGTSCHIRIARRCSG